MSVGSADVMSLTCQRNNVVEKMSMTDVHPRESFHLDGDDMDVKVIYSIASIAPSAPGVSNSQ